ncbi:MAG: hypothetical protein HPM95_04560 [Alphaproteobacteria bacterium]|nr:hypothetical protein [Alphaproteobacteria bacterium]
MTFVNPVGEAEYMQFKEEGAAMPPAAFSPRNPSWSTTTARSPKARSS